TGIERAHIERIARDREAAIVRATAGLVIRGRMVLINPERPARPGVERDDVVRPLRDVHDPIDDQRGRLPGSRDRTLRDPLQFEILDIRGIYLTQSTMALAEIAAGVRQPVVWLLRRIEQALVCHLRHQPVRHRHHENQRRRHEYSSSQTAAHKPFSVRRYATTAASSSELSLSR